MRSLLLAALLLAAGGATAHVAFDQGAWLATGTLHLEVAGAPLVVAETPLTVAVRADAPGPYAVRTVAEDGAASPWVPLRPEEGRHVAPLRFAAPGTWTVEARAGTEVAAFRLQAWPQAHGFVEPADEDAARGVLLPGPSALRFRVVDAAHAPLPPPPEAVARIEGPDRTWTEPLAVEDGVLVLRRTWDLGAHRVEVLAPSLGLVAGARPAHGVLVVGADEAHVYGLATKETPATAGAVVGAAVALAAAALGARRGWKGPGP